MDKPFLNRIKNIIPAYMHVPVMMTLVCNMLAYYGTRLINKSSYHFNFGSSLEDMIPVVPGTVVIYFGCYLFWLVNYIIGCRQEEYTAYRFICADSCAKIICMICFILMPTTNVRPVIIGDGIYDNVLRGLYMLDPADNLFPSIHCLTSWFSYIAVRKNEEVSKEYRFASLVMVLMVCVSTLTTKQHVLVDVCAGLTLAEASYYLVDRLGITEKYIKVMNELTHIFEDKKKTIFIR